MKRPLTKREAQIVIETPELRWPEDAWTEATHRAGQVPNYRLIARLAARMDSETAAATSEARQREADILASIDAQFARSAGRFRDERPTWGMMASDFAAWWLIAATVITVGTAGAAFWG